MLGLMWDYPTMTVITDAKRRVTLPKQFKPGDAFDIVTEGNQIVMHKLERPERRSAAKVTITKRRGTHPVGTVAGMKPLTTESVKRLLEEIP